MRGEQGKEGGAGAHARQYSGRAHGGCDTAERFDAIIIGAGQAGPALAARLDREGLTSAVIERKLVGGTCVNTGCIPTKTLVASAGAAHMARRGAEFGFSAGDVRVDMAAVTRRKDAVVKQSVDGVTKWIMGLKHVLPDVMYANRPHTTIQRAMHIHPTVSELVPTLLGGLAPLSDPGARKG